jgi:hypothetical protein
MRFSALPALTLLTVVTAPAPAGTISIAPTSSSITVGQSVTFTVSVNSADPKPVSPDSLFSAAVGITATGGPTTGTAGNFQLAVGLPAGSSFVGFGFVGAALTLGTNNLSSFDGALYTVDFTPTTPGTYTFSSPAGSSVAEYSGGLDLLTLSDPVTVNVLAAPVSVPEPAGLTVASICLGALAWRARPGRMRPSRCPGI